MRWHLIIFYAFVYLCVLDGRSTCSPSKGPLYKRGFFGLSKWEHARVMQSPRQTDLLLTSRLLHHICGGFEPVVIGTCVF